MPKTLLSGTLEEQCAFLLNLAQEKLAAGNYTGAVHALKEIQKYLPAYPGVDDLMVKAQAGKREQRTLVTSGFAGAIVCIFLGTWWGVPNDIWFLGLALGGAVAGYLMGNIAVAGRRSPSSQGRP